MMALRIDDLTAERERVESHLGRLKTAVLRHDPAARFSLHLSNIPEFWVLNAYVRSELTDDLDLQREVAEIGTDLLVEHNVPVLVSTYGREEHTD